MFGGVDIGGTRRGGCIWQKCLSATEDERKSKVIEKKVLRLFAVALD